MEPKFHGMIGAVIRMTLVFAAITFGAAQSHAYPEKPITIIVNSEAGGPTDLTARVLKEDLQTILGKPIVVENRLGAGGIVGAGIVAKATPDGYTLLMSGIGPMVLAPFLYSNLTYNPTTDFEPISLVVNVPVVLAMSATIPVNTLQEYITLARQQPGKLAYGTAGIGTPAHLGSELFKKLADIDVRFIPYRGSPDALLGLVRGDISVHISTPQVAYPHVESGKVKLLAVTGDKRLPGSPNTPTFAEAGLPKMQVPAWFALYAPKGVPQDIIAKLGAAIQKAAANPVSRATFERYSYTVVANSPDDFKKLFQDETAKTGQFIKENNIKVDQ